MLPIIPRTLAIFALGALLTVTAHAAVIVVPAGGNLQNVINSAQCGDVISVEAGASFRGPIELPAKSCTVDITIQSSRIAELPDGRVSPAQSPLMPKIIAPHADQAIRTKPGANRYVLDGIEVLPDPAATVMYDLVRLGESRQFQTTLASVPHHLRLDRVYIHGNGTLSFQRGISLNSSDTIISRSYIAGITGAGMDAQAIASWNTPGRNRISDTYLEATGENLMFGGADPASIDFIPSDTNVTRCHLFKRPEWRGKGWTIKNLLEFKNAQRINVTATILENNWGGEGQAGPAILFTVRNQEGSAPYSIVKDIFLENVTLKNSEGALNFLGTDNEKPSARGSKVTIRNSLFTGITGHFFTLNGFDDVTIENVTTTQTCTEGCNTMELYGQQSQRLVFRNNVVSEKPYGIHGDAGTQGQAAFDKFAPGAIFSGNVIGTPYDNLKLPGNEYPNPLIIGPDFKTPYVGKGADIEALDAAQSGLGGSLPTPNPTPSASPTPTPTPLPTPAPTPAPTPPPTPSPSPSPCAMSVTDSITLPEWSSGTLTLTLTGIPGSTQVTATVANGQVSINPWTPQAVSGTSAIIQYQVSAKKKASSITFTAPACGSKKVVVNVR